MKWSTLPRTSAYMVLTLGVIGALACAEEIPELVVGKGLGKVDLIVQKIGGDNQIGTVRNFLGDSLAVRVISPTGLPVGGLPVRWSSSAPQATMSPVNTHTNDDGIVKTRWTLGQLAGPQTATAEITSVSNPIHFFATAVPGVPSRFVRITGDGQVGIVGDELPDSIWVRITDAFDNSLSGIKVSFIYAASGDSGVLTVANPVEILNTGTAASPTITVNALSDADGNVKAAWTLGPTTTPLPCCVPRQAVRVSTPGATTQIFTVVVDLPDAGVSQRPPPE